MMKYIAYIVDTLKWIQTQRARDLQQYLPGHVLVPILPSHFIETRLSASTRPAPWPFDAVWLASWRTLLANPELKDVLPWDRTMASVTSHYNLGGGLQPKICYRNGADPAKEFAKAIEFFRCCRIVTCNSRILYDLLVPHLPDIVLAQNGVDATFFSPKEYDPFDRHCITFTSIGKRKAAKNLASMDAAIRHMEENHYWFLWNGHYIDKSGAWKMNREEIRSVLQRSRFYVCTSWCEGTPNGALEAAACGLPIITTHVGNMPELVREGETGWFIEPTAESLIACMDRLPYLEPWEYRRMSETIRLVIDMDWTWGNRCVPYREALEMICA